MNNQRLDRLAQTIIQRLATGCRNDDLGSATVAFYDTAWVALVSKGNGEQKEWLFPECFRFLLDNQSSDGGWSCHGSCDGQLLNTLAALLAMKKHSSAGGLIKHPDQLDLEARISKATRFLHEHLQAWDISESLLVGFEILVPALLTMLEHEGVRFDFLGRQQLDILNRTKLSNFEPEVLYSTSSSLLHSLEAFVDRIDFDKVSHHKTFGSMMASPASTAAYLMRASTWDIEAEQYLRKVIHKGAGNGSGGVPSVFPMPMFEISWSLSVLLEAGFTKTVLGVEDTHILTTYLHEHLQRQHGLVGFGIRSPPFMFLVSDQSSVAPLVVPDADDTAKVMLTTYLVQEAIKPDRMLEYFKSGNGHLRTYLGERHASFSANCNVLIALLRSPDVETYHVYISDILRFLCESWWRGDFKDKWNQSPQYSMMLLAETLTQVLIVWDRGLLQNLSKTLLQDRIPIILLQIQNRTLIAQSATNAWGSGDSPEITAYAILTLMAGHSLPWYAPLQEVALSSARSGQYFLDQFQSRWTEPSYVWIEKVPYGSATLSEAYCLAAMKVSVGSYQFSDRVKGLLAIPEEPPSKLVRFFSTLPCFRDEPRWKMMAPAVEGLAFLPQLRAKGTDILPELSEAKNEYLAYIPFSWIAINYHRRVFLSTDLLWDMMILTICNFRVDEYMESTVAKLPNDQLELTKQMIQELCSLNGLIALQRDAVSKRSDAAIHGNESFPKVDRGLGYLRSKGDDGHTSRADEFFVDAYDRYSISTMTSVRVVLTHYIRTMLNYPSVIGASTADRSRYSNALRTFLFSHITQISDNASFMTQISRVSSSTSIFTNPDQSFYQWVHNTGGESVSCPFAFNFLTCLLGAASRQRPQKPTEDCFNSTIHSYMAQELCTHLAAMSRLYNDFGSVERDRLEANINSINFPEFDERLHHVKSSTGTTTARREQRPKKELLALADFERQNAEVASEKLLLVLETGAESGEPPTRKRKADAVRLFVGVTTLYADLYVARDLSNRIETQR